MNGIITRNEAIARGLVRYFTGTPCKHGHVCERYTCNKSCVMCKNAQSKSWSAETGYQAKWRKENPEIQTRMGRDWRGKNPHKVEEYNVTPYARDISAINQMKRRAVRKGIDFSMTREDIKIPDLCPVLGIPLSRSTGFGRGGRADTSPSFDRVDNTKGYTPDNVRVISWRANRLKSDATIEELEAIIRYMKEQNGSL